MEYIVIKPKDAKEKWLICGFLGSETKSEYHVTTDIKEYAAKEGNDSNMLANHQSGVGNQVLQITANSTNGLYHDIPSIDNAILSITDKNCTNTVRTYLVPKKEKNARSDIQLVDDIVSLTTDNQQAGQETNSIGTNIPYRYRMVKPKEEVIDALPVLEMEIDDENEPPISKRAQNDDDSDDEDESQKREENVTQCQQCLKKLSVISSKGSIMNHAITHTDLKRFECSVKGCGFKHGVATYIVNHLKSKHNQKKVKIGSSVKKLELTTEQEKELDQVVKECFPKFESRSKRSDVGGKHQTSDENGETSKKGGRYKKRKDDMVPEEESDNDE